MQHIFVSYAREDVMYVRQLVHYLHNGDVQAWFDEQIPSGDRWTQVLQEKIDTSAAVVVIMSNASKASRYVEREIHQAIRRDRPICPLLLSGDVFFLLADYQYTDVTSGRMPPPTFVERLRAIGSTQAPAGGANVGTTVRPSQVWMAPRLEARILDRPELTDEVVKLLTASAGTIGLTTGLLGAGGFGKTTVAGLVCNRPEVRQRFPGGLLWATIGNARSAADVTTIINDLCWHLTGERPNLNDAEQAGYHLGRMLERQPPSLLVVDDVWRANDLTPFLLGAEHTTRLVTTRMEGILPYDATPVRVDEMTGAHARRLLLAGLPTLPASIAEGLLARTGGWPLLIAIVNGALFRRIRNGNNPSATADELLQRLVDDGPTALDVASRTGREQAVAVTVQRSLDLLSDAEQLRYLLLGILPEDIDLPFDAIALLWGLPTTEVRRQCEELAELSLVTGHRPDKGVVRLHDVLRDYAQHRLGAAVRLEAHLDLLRKAEVLLDAGGGQSTRKWWTLSTGASYMWHYLCYHLEEANALPELRALLEDLRWVEGRVSRDGVAQAAGDLARYPTEITRALRSALSREGHLLGHIIPQHSFADVFASRLSGIDKLRPVVERFRRGLNGDVTRLSNGWALPDTDTALVRTLVGHAGWVTAVAIAADASWLATAGDDNTVRIWNASTGENRSILVGHTSWVTGVAIAPDGTWLVTTSNDKTVRIWNTETGDHMLTLLGHADRVTGVAIAPDGAWLATTSNDKTVRIWDAATGHCRQAVHTGESWVDGVAIAPNGSWLATIGRDCMARIWDPTSGELRLTLAGHTGWITGVAVAPDGSWLATCSHDRTLRIWNASTGESRAAMKGHTRFMSGVAIAPDGSWLATTSNDQTVRIWDVAASEERLALVGHTDWVTGVAIASDGDWLATTSRDGTVRLWNALTQHAKPQQSERSGAVAGVAVAADDTWIATAGSDATVRVWDAKSGAPRATYSHHSDSVLAVAIAPDSTWLVSVGRDGIVIRDLESEQSRTTLGSHSSWVTGVAISPDGQWFATASYDQTARIWEATTGAQRSWLLGYVDRLMAVAVSPDGLWFVTAVGSDVRVSETESLRDRVTLKGHAGPVTAVAIAPDNAWLATASTDQTVRIWDASSGKLRSVLNGHDGAVTSVAIAPDGCRVATTGTDQTVRIWEPPTLTATMKVDGPLAGVAFRHDMKAIYAVGGRGIYAFNLHLPSRAEDRL